MMTNTIHSTVAPVSVEVSYWVGSAEGHDVRTSSYRTERSYYLGNDVRFTVGTGSTISKTFCILQTAASEYVYELLVLVENLGTLLVVSSSRMAEEETEAEQTSTRGVNGEWRKTNLAQQREGKGPWRLLLIGWDGIGTFHEFLARAQVSLPCRPIDVINYVGDRAWLLEA